MKNRSLALRFFFLRCVFKCTHPAAYAAPGNVFPRSHTVAKTNYSYEKRQRELAKKKKAEEKRQKKAHRQDGGTNPPEEDGTTTPAPDPTAPKTE